MIVKPHPYGRMANRLALAATFVAQAEEHGDAFLDLGFLEYGRFFEATRLTPYLYYRASRPQPRRPRRLVGCVNIWNTYDKRGEEYDLAGEAFASRQRDTRCLFVVGWLFRAHEAVRRHREVIRALFTPAARHREAVARLADRLRAGADRVVGVHIRQTDYQTFAGGKYFYGIDTYARLMRDVAGLSAGRTRFLLCSDAPLELGRFGGLDVMTGTGHPVEDNYALAACDCLMGPPSTYTVWASFYGGVPRFEISSPDGVPALADFKVVDTI